MPVETLYQAEITRLEGVAWDLRREFESGEAYTPRLRELYAGLIYARGDEDFWKRAKEQFPWGNCGIASVALQDRLGLGEITRASSYKHPGLGHTFLLVSREYGTIVDITADQFGGPKVFVGRIREPWRIAGYDVPLPKKDNQLQVKKFSELTGGPLREYWISDAPRLMSRAQQFLREEIK